MRGALVRCDPDVERLSAKGSVMRGHRFVEHVGEIELELEGSSEADLYVEALAAFRELVDSATTHGTAFQRELVLTEAEPALLLIDWLNELVFLAEVEGFVPERVERLELGEGLKATLTGVRGRPRHLVKAATLHDLELSNRGEEWHARVVLDV
jgi:SHS2 domain-containing protein